jgi:hypothetical protein
MKKIISFFKRKTKTVTPNVYCINLHHNKFGNFMAIGVDFSLDAFVARKKDELVEKVKGVHQTEIQLGQYVHISGDDVLSEMVDINISEESKSEETDLNKVMQDLIDSASIAKVKSDKKLTEEQKQFIIDKINKKK